ncbi:MAG: multidrug transporter [Legionellales bacterium RIFCSPHIGHO2_12_FULL_37_14]|nr:MAG: multidrug transporter [Legionellales bacterium RIFCSPHIGHO2_12_FULL_37_14]
MNDNFSLKNRFLNIPLLTILILGFILLYHCLAYLIPFTDNAFVVTNISPVAADVSGFITDIYVKNGQSVKKNQPIFKVYQAPYSYALQEALALRQSVQKRIKVLNQQIYKTESIIHSIESQLAKKKYELSLKKVRQVAEAISKLEIKKLNYDVDILTHRLESFKKEILVLKAKIEETKSSLAAAKAKESIAKINLELTIVRAPSDGVVDNLYVSINTPIRIHQPVFSFVDTSKFYIQANFKETNLRHVRQGNKAYIMLRMYYTDKIFHGKVVNSLWATERQKTAIKSQLQRVKNENEWLLLPQRFPIQIEITDPQPNFPLHPGASAYVYISPSASNRKI